MSKKKNKRKPMNKSLRTLLLAWATVIVYELFFINTKFGLENFFDENSVLYTIFITVPLVAALAFLGAFVVASHTKEIKDTWKKTPEKIIDELKLLGLGILFFFFIWGIYIIFNKPL